MQFSLSSRSVRRPALLAGCAALALLLVATGAQAQTTGATAGGAQVTVNDQALRSGTIVADASDTEIRSAAAGDVAGSSIILTDNAVHATGRGNVAELTLTAGLPNGTFSDRVAALAAGSGGASADGAMVIANHQSIGTAFVNGDIFGARASIAAGRVASGRLTLSGNAQDAAATGNDATAMLTSAAGGAGIATSQSTAFGSGVAARARGGYDLATGAIDASAIDAGGNLDRAVATGNSSESTLSSRTSMLALGDGGDAASVLPVTSGGDAITRAAVASVTSQSAGGIVKAVTADENGAPVFRTRGSGDADASSIASSANTLAAAGRGNVATTGIDITTSNVVPSNSEGGAPGPIAVLVTVQKAAGLNLSATAIGGTEVSIGGGLSGSNLSASRNVATTAATTNRSEGRLSLTAATVDAARGPGLATVDAFGLSTADAGVAVHTVQDFGTGPVQALRSDAKVVLTVSGDTDRSRITAAGNTDLVAATGNDGTSVAAVDARSFKASVAVNSLQTGNGDVAASLGATGLPGGTRVVADGAVTDSALAVRDNRYLASAVGNLGTNAIQVVAGQGQGAFGSGAISGSMGDSYGASADVALASNQKLGEPGNGSAPLQKIVSSVVTQSGIGTAGPVENSTLGVEGNQQQAVAIGNTVSNRLAYSATGQGEGVGPMTASLASTQFGQAAVSATSSARFLIEGDLTGSEASLSGNSNSALAAVNDADNTLAIDAIDAVGTGGAGVADLSSDRFGPPAARGDHVLTGQQFASGSVGASVTTRIGGGTASGLDGSSYRIAGNRTEGEASANRAINTVSMRAIDGAPGTGLANTQVNGAVVQVSAVSDIGGPAASSAGASATGADVRIDGNSASALARGNAAENSITVFAGAGTHGTTSTASTDRFGAEVSGGPALLNVQTNFAPVIASAADTSFLAPLNGGGLDGTQLSITGNTVSASGYGNVALNSVSISGLGAPAAAIVNSQTNNGNVYAIVTGAGFNSAPGSLGAASLSMSGNQLSAMAVGNQVSSAITGLR